MTPLDKTIRRSLTIDGEGYVLSFSPESLKITVKGRRLGLELPWKKLVSGEAALAIALQASVGKLAGNVGEPKISKKPSNGRRSR